jgi:uncharacterized protein (DUF488 family)
MGVAADLLLTVGHSTRSSAEFLELLRAHSVAELVDVRRFPASRRHPWFNRDALAAALAGVEIAYAHMEELGGRRGSPDPASPHTGWRVASFRAYADRMAEPEWLAALAELERRARRARVAFMCAEAVPWKCHRRLIADALVGRGWEVRHLLAADRADPHELPEFARVLPGGDVVYDAEPQGRLFPG